MKLLKNLLTEIGRIVVKEKAALEVRRQQGDYFNIFKVLRLSENETKHSLFLAELLNPKGGHGMKDAFLRKFVDELNAVATNPLNQFTVEKARVRTEFPIGGKTKEEGGRIDILIEDGSGHAIIIENKIWANDQEAQLLRYDNFARYGKMGKMLGGNGYGKGNYLLVYLTPYGDEASDFSTKRKVKDYTTISYEKFILNWLDQCLNIVLDTHPVKELIRQYILNTNDILYLMSNHYNNKITDIATSADYKEATLSILDNADEIKRRIRIEFIDKVIDLANSYGYELGKQEEIDNVANLTTNSCLIFYKTSISTCWGIALGIEKWRAYYGLSTDMKTSRITKAMASELVPAVWGNEGDCFDDWPIGWEWIESPWDYWDDMKVLKDMVSPQSELLSVIEQNMFQRLSDKKLRKIVKILRSTNNSNLHRRSRK